MDSRSVLPGCFSNEVNFRNFESQREKWPQATFAGESVSHDEYEDNQGGLLNKGHRVEAASDVGGVEHSTSVKESQISTEFSFQNSQTSASGLQNLRLSRVPGTDKYQRGLIEFFFISKITTTSCLCCLLNSQCLTMAQILG